MPDPYWRQHAACRTENADLFTATGRRVAARNQRAEAKTVCRRCPVTADCLRWALATPGVLGVWGGTDDDERALLRTTTVARGAA